MYFFYKYLHKISFVGLILFFANSPNLYARNKLAVIKYRISTADTIKGIITDDYGKPVFDAQVKVQGKPTTAASDRNGFFAIAAVIGDKLLIKHAEYYQQLVTADRNVLKVQLRPVYLSDADYVNVLYGKKPVSSILGAVATVNSNQLTTSPVPSLLTTLAGRLPGLNIGQTSGYPGTDGDGQGINPANTASIRGYIGKMPGGQSDLIVLIDGAIRPYNTVDPQEIESVTLLKDAISTVMFGQRSTPGMLLITTKKGGGGAPRISFTAQSAIQQPIGFPKTLSAYDYANLYDQTQINSGIAPTAVKFSPTALNAYQTGSDPYLYPNVNWKNMILKNTTNQNQYNFNIQGSGTGIHYFVSADYLKDNGIFNTASFNSYNTSPDYSRYSVRSNIGADLNKSLTLDVGLYTRIEDQTQPGNNDAQGILNTVFTTPALAYPVRNPNGSYGGNSTYTTNLYGRDVQSGYSLTNTKALSFDIALTQKLDKILNGLYIKASGDVNVTTQYLTNRLKTYAVYPISAATGGTGYTYGTAIGTATDIPIPVTTTSSGTEVFKQTSSYIEGLAGYDHNFGANALSVKLVANQQSTIRNMDLPYIYNTFAANASYNYQQKYFAEAAGSYGSFNQFAPAKKYSPFYAGALGWNLAKENFIKDNVSWISNLKLRVNYGVTGYVNRGNYGYFSYIQRYDNTGTYYYFGSSATGSQGYAESGIANAEASGEKAKKLNAGIDIGLFKDHLSITADYFNNNLYDIWVVPGAAFQVLGNNPPAQNIGKQKYSGSEFTVTYKNNANNFNYFATLNLSVVSSKSVYSAEAPAANSYQLLTGQPVGVFSGLTAAGLFRSQAEINTAAIPSDVARASIKPGDIKYVDRNNDGIIDTKDVGPVGTTKPQIVYGATIGFSYKGLDFSMLIQGIQNRQVYLSGDYEWAFRNNGNNTAFQNNLNAYSPTNPNAVYPRLTIGTNVNNEKTSNFWLHDAGFARLKNAEIGYTLPSTWTSKIRIPSARVFINGENLVTVSQLNDFGTKPDPEVFGSNYPIQRTINFGINIKL